MVVIPTFRLPSDSQHTAIIGRNGSGKTQAGVWQLSQRSIETRPWVIVDYKGDELIRDIEHIKEIDLSKAPTRPGLYVVRPIPEDDDDDVDAFLMQVWARGHTGLYFDEGYMVPNRKAFRAILTQGRSKNIPVICLSQRPTWISRYVWSEAAFFQVFDLNAKDDRKTVQGFVPANLDIELPQYHSVWHDVLRKQTMILKPAPDRDTILATFHERLGLKQRYL